MHGDWYPRLPGSGLAPTPEAHHVNVREQDALLRDALAREESAYRETREPRPPALRRRTVRRPARAGLA
jgi:hypothetical protein